MGKTVKLPISNFLLDEPHAHADKLWGPYPSLDAAAAAIPTAMKVASFKFGVLSGGVFSEYIYLENNGTPQELASLKVQLLPNPASGAVAGKILSLGNDLKPVWVDPSSTAERVSFDNSEEIFDGNVSTVQAAIEALKDLLDVLDGDVVKRILVNGSEVSIENGVASITIPDAVTSVIANNELVFQTPDGQSVKGKVGITTGADGLLHLTLTDEEGNTYSSPIAGLRVDGNALQYSNDGETWVTVQTFGKLAIKYAQASDPASGDEGDLALVGTTNAYVLKVYVGGSWVSVCDFGALDLTSDGITMVGENKTLTQKMVELSSNVTAINEQLSASTGTAPEYTTLPKLEIEPGVYIKTGCRLNGQVGSVIVETSTLPNYPGYKYIKLDVHSYVGKEIAIRCKSAANTKDYIFTDSSNIVIATDNIVDSNILTVPTNSYYLYLNQYLQSGDVITPGAALVNSTASGDIGYLRDTVDEISEALITDSISEIETELTPGKMINSTGELVDSPSYSVTDFINVTPGNDYSFTGSLSSNHTIGICGYDDNNVPQCTVLKGTASDYIFENKVFTIPFGVTKIRVNGTTAAGITIKETQHSSKLDELHELSEKYEQIDGKIEQIDGKIEQIETALGNLPSGETEKEVLEEIPIDTFIVGFVKEPSGTDKTDITIATNQTGYATTDYIQVEPGEKLFVSCAAYMQARCVQGYKLVNGVYTWVKTIIAANNACYKQEFTVDQDIEFIRINSQTTWAIRLWRKKTVSIGTVAKKAIHKNVRWVGMSIWAHNFCILGSGIGGNVRARGYQSLINEQFDFDWDNSNLTSHNGNSLGALQSDLDGSDGIGSSIIQRIVNNSNGNYGELLNAIWTLDTITNDFRRNIPLGTSDDYDNNTGPLTYYGALRMFNDKVRELSGDGVIVIAANSLRRNNAGYTSTSTNSVGCTLEDYEKALMYAVVKNGWYFVDQYRLSGITDNTIALTTTDGLHLNNTGYKLAVLPWIAVFDQIYNKQLVSN